MANSGSAIAQPAYSRYGYNDRSELIAADRYLGSDPDALVNPVTAEQRGYLYDPIGNRTRATEAGAPVTYQTNEVNQYTDIGAAQPAYDDDGNMITTADNKAYTYNAENRLVAVQPQIPADGDIKVEMVYDYMGRRVQKVVSLYVAGVWTLQKEILFVYDGWNMVKESAIAAGQTNVDKYYVWGLDLSQSLQGAGGVGGLLATVDGSLTYHYLYDANGNVGQVVDATDGSIAAHYEYDGFGNEILATAAFADANPYRFSTKYFDQEVDLYYYGYRYYSPNLGRWINRDPIEEDGGFNLYAFTYNNGIDRYDLHGLWGAWRHKNMTYRAYRFATPGFKDLSGELWINVLHFLQDSNISVDSGETFKINAWHFNRNIGEDKEFAKSAYTELLNSNWDKIIEKINSADEENCASALEIVGMLSHAWQDYFAHAIHKDSDGSKETIGMVTGNPDATGADMKPSSWGGLWPPRFGEHGASEPGKRAPDTAARIKSAENFTAEKFENFLKVFWEPCKCHINERFRK